MASKKCPKCGEDNPAEAVMCWACYTPLSGSAPLGAGLAGAAAAAIPKTAGAPVGIPQTQAPEKKALDPKMIGVGAVLLLGVAAAVMMSGAMGGSGDGGVAVPPETPPVTEGGGGGGPVAPAPVVAPPIAGGNSGGTAPAAVPVNFQTVATPGNYTTGTIGILMTNNSSPAGAAKFAKNQFARNGNWTNMQVAVFTDKATANQFADFQRANQNKPLTGAGFKRLAEMGVWNTTPAFLDSRKGQDRIYYPSQSPQAWWPNR